MPRMPRPHAAPPPPLAGKDGASQRVSECNTPTGRWMSCISSLFLHKDLWHKLSGRSHFSFPFLGVAMVFIFFQMWNMSLLTFRSLFLEVAAEEEALLWLVLTNAVWNLFKNAASSYWANKQTHRRRRSRDTYVLCCHWYISVGASVCPELTLRLSLPFCLQVSQRSPSLTSDQSQKSVESLFSARWVLKPWQTEFSLYYQPWLWNYGFYPYDLRDHQRSHLHKN